MSMVSGQSTTIYRVLPTIGSSGTFDFKYPFSNGEQNSFKHIYTVKSIRKISDYLAANEDVKGSVYDFYGISSDYDLDASRDEVIVSLQSNKGVWLYVPAQYINSYPVTNGVPYRSVMIGVSLPPIPVNQDISQVTNDIGTIVHYYLGIQAQVAIVETSQVVLVAKADHDYYQAERETMKEVNPTHIQKYYKAAADLEVALTKIAMLEQYIKDNPP